MEPLWQPSCANTPIWGGISAAKRSVCSTLRYLNDSGTWLVADKRRGRTVMARPLRVSTLSLVPYVVSIIGLRRGGAISVSESS